MVSLLIVCLLLTLVTLVVYGQLGSHAFIHFDDNLYIYENAHVRTGLSWSNIVWAFTEYRSNTWHPVTWLSHMLDCQLFGLEAGKHHLVTVLLHGLNSVLVFLLLRRMTGALWRSAAVAAFFAVHPMHVESVAWASERKDVLSLFFALLTIGAYTIYGRRPTPARYAPVLLFFALGIMAKPMLVTLPFLLLLLDYWPLARFGGAGANARPTKFSGRLLLEKLPLLALAAVSSALTMMAQRSLQQHSLWMRTTTALVSCLRYAGKLLVPLTQAFYYPYPKQPPVLGAVFSGLVLVALTLWFFRLRRAKAYAVVGWLWYLGALVPVIGFEQVATHAIADRYTYLPSIGLSILVAWGLADAARRWPRGQSVLATLAAVAFVAFAVKARVQAAYWKDGVTLFTRDVQVVRENTLGWRNLGVALCDQGRYEEAIPMFRNVLGVYPHDAVSLFDIASAEEKLGRLAAAAARYRESLHYDSSRAEAHYNLGNTLARMGRPDEAIPEFRSAVGLEPDFAAAYNNLGNTLSRTDRDSEAIAAYQEAIRRNRSYAEAHNNLGTTYRKLGRGEAALEEFGAALRISPDFAAAEFNTAIVHLMRRDTAEARRHFAAAVRLKPELSDGLPPQFRNVPGAATRLGP